MTAIKITPANAARIQAMLAEANGRATSHTIRACSDVIAIGSTRPIAANTMYQSAASASPNCVGPDTKPPGRSIDWSIGRRARAEPGPISAHVFPVPGKSSSIMAFT